MHLELGSIVGVGVGSLVSLIDVEPLNEDDTPSIDLLCCVGLEFLASRRHRRLPFKRSASISKGNRPF